MNLSQPSTKFPVLEQDGKLNHNWQRWFSDLYDKVKEIEKKHDDLITVVNNYISIIDNYISTHP